MRSESEAAPAGGGVGAALSMIATPTNEFGMQLDLGSWPRAPASSRGCKPPTQGRRLASQAGGGAAKAFGGRRARSLLCNAGRHGQISKRNRAAFIHVCASATGVDKQRRLME